MSREVDTYSIVQTRADGVRERLHLLPAGNVIVGEVEFPDFCVMGITGGGAAFEKYPSGMIKYDERSITFNLDNLFEFDPTLTDYIFAPTYEDYMNIWTISDDDGNPATDLDDFVVRFRGVQTAQPTEKFEGELSYTKFTIKLLHIARHLAESSVPADIANAMIAQEAPYDFATISRYNLYDIIDYSTTVKTVVLDSGRSSKSTDQPGSFNQIAIMMKYSDLFVAIQLYMQAWYRYLLHDDTLNLTYKDSFVPYQVCTFRSVDLSTGEPGITTISNLNGTPVFEVGVGTHRQLWFCALVGQQGYFFADPASGFDYGGYPVELIGGYLKDESMFRSYKSMQDWLSDIASNYAAKLTYEITAVGDVKFCVSKVKSGTPIALSKSSFIREKKSYERNRDRLRGCDAQVVGGGSGDIGQVEYFKDANTENRPEGNIKCVFHNLPSADKLDEEQITFDAIPWYAPEIKALSGYGGGGGGYVYVPQLIARHREFRANVLYSDETNTDVFTSSDVQFVRVHRSVSVDSGTDTYYDAPVIEFPDLIGKDITTRIDLLQGYSTAVQKLDGLPMAICKANTEIYSNTMLYEGTADQTVVSPSDVGKVYDVSEFIHAALDGKTPTTAVLRKAVENRDPQSNILPTTVELFAF